MSAYGDYDETYDHYMEVFENSSNLTPERISNIATQKQFVLCYGTSDDNVFLLSFISSYVLLSPRFIQLIPCNS